jgi:hypothetical protein
MAFYSLAVDFGSKYFSIAIIGQNRVVKEPSVVAYSLKEINILGLVIRHWNYTRKQK